MSKDEALKLALEALETCCAGDYSTGHVIDPSFDEDAVNEAIISLKEALAPTSTPCEVQDEQSSSQEVDWKDQYEKQKRRAEMWRAKLEKVVGPLPYAVPLAQLGQEPVAIYRAGQAKGEGFHVEFLKEMGDDEVLLYTAPPKEQQSCDKRPWGKPWVSLTDDERANCWRSSAKQTAINIEAKLKELNT